VKPGAAGGVSPGTTNEVSPGTTNEVSPGTTSEVSFGTAGKGSLPWIFLGTGVLLVLWEAASRITGSALILPGPLPVLKRLRALLGTEKFLSSLGNSFCRVALGILLSAPLGVIAGIASGLDKRVRACMAPLFSVISATPVMSVILIVFLWFGQERTPVFTAFLMIFPVMAANTMEGVGSVDRRLEELCLVFKLSRKERLRRLYIPAVTPFILGGLRSSLSLCWKVVVAAEVLVQPLRALGTGMQTAKAQLETAELFAWTAATVIAAALSERLLALGLLVYRGRGCRK
jgi:NitT/TauT family transport system permease protein